MEKTKHPRQYPTKDSILEKEIKFKKGVIDAVKDWKKNKWLKAKKGGRDTKFGALKSLIKRLADIYDTEVTIKYVEEIPSCKYDPINKTIYINSTVSIVSGLHEFAHHLYGVNETKACKWSVWLFKKTFKKAYNNLEWSGHMLVKPRRQDEVEMPTIPEASTETSSIEEAKDVPEEKGA